MMQYKNSFFFIALTLLLSACTTQTYTKQTSIFIVFKTPTFKHADLGFIYENDEALKVEIYGSGQAILSLEVGKDNICMSLLECLDKKSFNEKVLNEHYPIDILSNIFRGKAIFAGKNMFQLSNGFSQKLDKVGQYDIRYSVLNKHILFHDIINDISIKVKRLK